MFCDGFWLEHCPVFFSDEYNKLCWNILNVEFSREELASACTGLEADILMVHIHPALHICVVVGDVNFGSAAVPFFRPEEVVIQNQMTAEWTDRDRDKSSSRKRWTSLLRSLSPAAPIMTRK